MLPTMFCPGASKSGTTTLHDILQKHPQVYTGTIKEPHFFDSDDYRRGKDFYESQYYPRGEDALIAADFTPSYLQEEAWGLRIREMLGDRVKMVVLLRNPVERAFSAFQFDRQRNGGSYDEWDAILDRAVHSAPEEMPKFIRDGFYGRQLEAYLKIFPRENVRIYLFEDFVAHMQERMDEITDFLEISRITLEKEYHSNRTRQPSSRIGKAYLRARHSIQVFLRPFRRGRYSTLLFRPEIIAAVKRLERLVFDRKTGGRQLDGRSRQILRGIYGADVEKLKKLLKNDWNLWRDFS